MFVCSFARFVVSLCTFLTNAVSKPCPSRQGQKWKIIGLMSVFRHCLCCVADVIFLDENIGDVMTTRSSMKI